MTNRTTFLHLLRRLAPFLVAYALLLALSLGQAADLTTFDITRQQYGANYPGDLGWVLRHGAVEVAVLIAILRPWSYRGNLGRALAAMLLTGIWGLAHIVYCMHCGSIGIGHTMWLLLMAVALFVLVLWTGRRGTPPPDERAV